jgi:hypothetical protein
MSQVLYHLGIIWTSSVSLIYRFKPMATIPTTTLASSEVQTDILLGISTGSMGRQDRIFAWRYTKTFLHHPPLRSARLCFTLPILSSRQDPPSRSGRQSRWTASARYESFRVPMRRSALARFAEGPVPLNGCTSLDDPDKDTQLVPERHVPGPKQGQDGLAYPSDQTKGWFEVYVALWLGFSG